MRSVLRLLINLLCVLRLLCLLHLEQLIHQLIHAGACPWLLLLLLQPQPLLTHLLQQRPLRRQPRTCHWPCWRASVGSGA